VYIHAAVYCILHATEYCTTVTTGTMTACSATVHGVLRDHDHNIDSTCTQNYSWHAVYSVVQYSVACSVCSICSTMQYMLSCSTVYSSTVACSSAQQLISAHSSNSSQHVYCTTVYSSTACISSSAQCYCIVYELHDCTYCIVLTSSSSSRRVRNCILLQYTVLLYTLN